MTKILLDALSQMPEAVVYGVEGDEKRTSVISVNIRGKDPAEAALLLDREFGICADVITAFSRSESEEIQRC